MGNYAIIENNVVKMIVAADNAEKAAEVFGAYKIIEVAEGNFVGVGFIYNEETQKFSNETIADVEVVEPAKVLK